MVVGNECLGVRGAPRWDGGRAWRLNCGLIRPTWVGGALATIQVMAWPHPLQWVGWSCHDLTLSAWTVFQPWVLGGVTHCFTSDSQPRELMVVYTELAHCINVLSDRAGGFRECPGVARVSCLDLGDSQDSSMPQGWGPHSFLWIAVCRNRIFFW